MAFRAIRARRGRPRPRICKLFRGTGKGFGIGKFYFVSARTRLHILGVNEVGLGKHETCRQVAAA